MGVVAGIIGAVISGIQAAAAAFATLSVFAQLAISVTISLASSFLRGLLAPSGGTNIEAAKTTVRITEPVRWLNAGLYRQGGGVVFGEFDDQGCFWWIVIHSDSILTNTIEYYLDDILVELDSAGNVITNEFCLTPDFDPYEGSGPRVTYFNIQTTTYSPGDPVPPSIAAFNARFPGLWTSEHVLAGTTFSVVKGNAIPFEERYKIYRWRGAFGLGEPAVSVAGEWNVAFDPRDPSQDLNDPTTYKFTKNPVLLWAWFRTHPRGRNKANSEINWQRVGEQADICDQTVNGIDGTHKRYECGIAAPEDTERNLIEQQILMSCDAILMFDDIGAAWPRVGYYEHPTVTIHRNRDIVAMEAIDNSQIEDQKQGVIVRYLEPTANYALQPSSPWRNPEYYVEGEPADYLIIDIPTCQNHNQAMRLAKIIGQRSQSNYRLGPTVGMRGLNVRNERIIDVAYDNVYSGPHEVVTPVQVDPQGIIWGFGCVPIDENRYDLLPGEELPAPANVGNTGMISMMDNLSGFFAEATNDIITATFTRPARADLSGQVQYVRTGFSAFTDMTVNTINGTAFSGTLLPGLYTVRYRTMTSGGSVSPWFTFGTVNIGGVLP